jgi:hypothetical protein
MARPKIEITDEDWIKIDKMAGIFCTGEEIANIMGFSYDTLERRVKETHGISCADYIRQKSDRGRMSLRRKQYEVAGSGNVSMLIWLGKQFLNQSDKQDQSVTIDKKKLIIDMGDDDK